MEMGAMSEVTEVKCEVKIWPWEDRARAPIGYHVSVGEQTKLGRGFKPAYKEWLWRGIKYRDPYVMDQLNFLRDRMKHHKVMVLLYDHQVVGEGVKACLEWGGW